MNKDQVRAIALQHGFELKEQADGTRDLHPYVYEFAQALLETALEADPFAFVDTFSNRLVWPGGIVTNSEGRMLPLYRPLSESGKP
jgi:hypothetical protein